MRIPRKLLWLIAFAVCTFFWIVIFAHGWRPQRFLSGVREELSRILVALARALGRGDAP